MLSAEAMMTFMFLLLQTFGTEHSAVHGYVVIPGSHRQVAEMQATSLPGATLEFGKHALHTNPHQQETLIQPYKHYLAITKKKLQITNPLEFAKRMSP